VRILKDERGLSLWELILVLALLGLMAALGLPNLVTDRDKGEQLTDKAWVERLEAAARLYHEDTGVYPGNVRDLREPTVSGWRGPYDFAEELPRDLLVVFSVTGEVLIERP
jgi:general secretion pathway protein G